MTLIGKHTAVPIYCSENNLNALFRPLDSHESRLTDLMKKNMCGMRAAFKPR